MRFLDKTEQNSHETVELQEEHGSSKGGRRKRDPRWRLYLPEILILLLSLMALAVVGPLRDILAPVPALLFLAAFALFMVPGLVLSLALLPGPDLAKQEHHLLRNHLRRHTRLVFSTRGYQDRTKKGSGGE